MGSGETERAYHKYVGPILGRHILFMECNIVRLSLVIITVEKKVTQTVNEPRSLIRTYSCFGKRKRDDLPLS